MECKKQNRETEKGHTNIRSVELERPEQPSRREGISWPVSTTSRLWNRHRVQKAKSVTSKSGTLTK